MKMILIIGVIFGIGEVFVNYVVLCGYQVIVCGCNQEKFDMFVKYQNIQLL